MKWQLILPVVALMALSFVPQAALARHHHCWGNNGYGSYGMNGMGMGMGGMNPYQMQRLMQMQSYGRGWGGYGGYGNGYGNGYGYGNNGAMLSGFGRVLRGF